MTPATTLSSVVDADRSGEQLAFRVLADGISDRIRRKWKEVIASLPKVLRQCGSGMITGSTINYIAAHFLRSVLDWRRSNRRLSALRTGWQCACLYPADPYYYKALVYALISPSTVRRLRRAFVPTPLETAK